MLQVYNPLQQQTGTLQGSAGVLQGSVPALQGSVQPVQGPVFNQPAPAPAPAPAPSRTATRSTVRPAAAPVQPAGTDLSSRYANVGGTIYDMQSGQAFSTPQQFFQSSGVNSFNGVQFNTQWQPPAQTVQPQQPQQQIIDPNQQLAQQAGQAGLDPAALAKLLGLTQDERSSVDSSLGIDQLAQQVFTPPSQTTQQIYQQAFDAAGLANIKTQFTELQAKINTRNDELNKQINAIGENPWLSEASRVGRVKRLQELAQGDIQNLVNQAQQVADLYNQGLEQVHQLVSYQNQDFQNNQQLNAAKLQYLEQQAEKQLQSLQDSKVARYMPEYLKSLTASQKPTTVTASDGSILRWNPDSQKFETVYEAAQKPITLNQGDLLIDPKTGQPISYNPKTYAPGSGGGGGGYIAGDANAPLYAGLNSATSTAIRAQVNAFKTEPTVQNFATIQEGYNFASSISNTTKNPADDQALIYSLAKALDPGSVVREGEYATAQKYAQSWIAAFGKSVTQAISGTGFLSTEARENIKKTITSKYQASKKSYDNLYSQYSKGINALSGRDDGKEFLRDYTTTAESTNSSNPLGLPGF